MTTTEYYNELARQLKEGIVNGHYSDVQKLLGPVIKQEVIRLIEHRFMCLFDPPIDPVNFAINCGREKIGLYLVEKAFPLHHVYWEEAQEEKKVCDKWCYKDHGPDDCPHQYSASRNAEKHKMEALKLRIDEIRQGKRNPGEGLSEPYIDRFLPHPAPPLQQKPKMNRWEKGQVTDTKPSGERTVADEAREIVTKHGIRYESKNKGTLLHKFIDKPKVFVYILANFGVPVNVQNVDGDTALHLAVRRKRIDVVEALVQCSADISIRNKMGQTPVDEAEGPVKLFLSTFERGVVAAVRECKYNSLYKQYKRSWCNVHTKIKDNMSLLEWTQEKAESAVLADSVKVSQRAHFKQQTDAAAMSFRILTDYRPTSELIHAVLCEDADLAQKILEGTRDLKVNIRFRDRKGKTLLSHAVESNNLKLVQLLLEHGAKVSQVRVRENEQTDVTVPLYQKALRRDIDLNIVQELQTVLPDKREHEEKDTNGNTPLLRAIQEGLGVPTIQYLLKVREGYSLRDRNKDGLTARELASKLEHWDIVKAIDKFIMKKVPHITLRLFPVSFQGTDFLKTVDETGTSLEQMLNKTAEERHMKCWIDVNQTQNQAISLFTAAATGDLITINQLCDADYQDKNGYTALTRAIVFDQLKAARLLCEQRPALKITGDNSNRYPLHYAYALPEEQGKQFIRLLLEKDAASIEQRMDKDGRVAADYKLLRQEVEIRELLYNARTLDAFGKRGGPLGPWPVGAEKDLP